MKNYEWFNKLEKEEKSPEIQSLEMLLSYIGESKNIKLPIETLVARYEGQLAWLEEEKEG